MKIRSKLTGNTYIAEQSPIYTDKWIVNYGSDEFGYVHKDRLWEAFEIVKEHVQADIRANAEWNLEKGKQ